MKPTIYRTKEGIKIDMPESSNFEIEMFIMGFICSFTDEDEKIKLGTKISADSINKAIECGLYPEYIDLIKTLNREV